MNLTPFVSEPIDLTPILESEEDCRIDLEFYGVDHSSSSFEARVFLNNPEADSTTAMEEASGYLGSFFIFGHGNCFGDEGHCDVPQAPRSVYDRRPPHKLEGQKHIIVLSKDQLANATSQPDDVQITVVPIASDSPVEAEGDLFIFDYLKFLAYEPQ